MFLGICYFTRRFSYGFHVISRLVLVSIERKRAKDRAQDSHSGGARFELGLRHRVSEGYAWFSSVVHGNFGNVPQFN